MVTNILIVLAGVCAGLSTSRTVTNTWRVGLVATTTALILVIIKS